MQKFTVEIMKGDALLFQRDCKLFYLRFKFNCCMALILFSLGIKHSDAFEINFHILMATFTRDRNVN